MKRVTTGKIRSQDVSGGERKKQREEELKRDGVSGNGFGSMDRGDSGWHSLIV